MSSAERALHVLPPLHEALAQPEPDSRIFRTYLSELGLAQNTVANYMRMMFRADAWCEERGHPLSTAPGPMIAEFANTLPKSKATRRQLHQSLRHYWTMHDRFRPPLWAIKVPKERRMVCRALEPEEATELARCATERGDREGLAVLLGLYQGFRVSEIANLRWDDLDREGWIKVIGKGDLGATLPLHPVLAAALTAYRAKVTGRRSDEPWVFPGRIDGSGPVHPATVWGWVKRVAAGAGLENVSTHRLRHTCLATALDSTKDLRAVRDFARHASVSTTEGYTRTTAARLRAVMASIQYEPGAITRGECETTYPLRVGRPGRCRPRLDRGGRDGVGQRNPASLSPRATHVGPLARSAGRGRLRMAPSSRLSRSWLAGDHVPGETGPRVLRPVSHQFVGRASFLRSRITERCVTGCDAVAHEPRLRV